jgi:hypothetical protein
MRAECRTETRGPWARAIHANIGGVWAAALCGGVGHYAIHSDYGQQQGHNAKPPRRFARKRRTPKGGLAHSSQNMRTTTAAPNIPYLTRAPAGPEAAIGTAKLLPLIHRRLLRLQRADILHADVEVVFELRGFREKRIRHFDVFLLNNAIGLTELGFVLLENSSISAGGSRSASLPSLLR